MHKAVLDIFVDNTALTLRQTSEMTLFGNCSGGSCDNATTNEAEDSLQMERAVEILTYTKYVLLPLSLIFTVDYFII
jgi:hypothetical protein